MRPKWIATMIFRCEIVVFGGFASGHADLRMDGRMGTPTNKKTFTIPTFALYMVNRIQREEAKAIYSELLAVIGRK